MKRTTSLFVLALASIMLIAGCDKTLGPVGKGELSMYMVDAPASYEAVTINVKEVAVHSSSQGWIVINSTPRTFNLLDLTNGAMALLGNATLDAGKYTQIRLLLDSGNTITLDGTTHPLTVPSGLQTGLKLVHNFDIEEGTRYELLLDFDAARSVIDAGGTFQLKPTIRVRALALTGAIAGTIEPASASALITAISAQDTASTFATGSGAFKLVGLNPASYAVSVHATGGSYRDTTIVNVQVTAGTTTNLGTIVLSQ